MHWDKMGCMDTDRIGLQWIELNMDKIRFIDRLIDL